MKDDEKMIYDALLFCVVLSVILRGGIGENKETLKTAKNGTLHNNKQTAIRVSQSIKTTQEGKGKSLTIFTLKE